MSKKIVKKKLEDFRLGDDGSIHSHKVNRTYARRNELRDYELAAFEKRPSLQGPSVCSDAIYRIAA